ncbi:MAG: nitroreductase family protein [Anaerolineales bacterium]|nr:nitroreductase family protein [Anaerolineales bacterium]
MKTDFFEVVRTRRSIRRFDERAVEEEKLHAVLEAANRAPSAGNVQAYEIYLAKTQAARARLASTLPQMEFFSEAPVVLAFCANPERAVLRYSDRGRTLYSVQDATIACTHAMLAATALGLAGVWVGAFQEQAVSEALHLPASVRPVALLPIGYPGESAEPRPRRTLDSIVHNVL